MVMPIYLANYYTEEKASTFDMTAGAFSGLCITLQRPPPDMSTFDSTLRPASNT
jgi:hypothetical protein